MRRQLLPLRHQLLHQQPHLLRRRVPRDHLVVADPGLPQRFLFDRIPCRRAALVMPSALVFDCVAGAAVGVDQQRVHPLGIDAAICRDTPSAERLSSSDTERAFLQLTDSVILPI